MATPPIASINTPSPFGGGNIRIQGKTSLQAIVGGNNSGKTTALKALCSDKSYVKYRITRDFIFDDLFKLLIAEQPTNPNLINRLNNKSITEKIDSDMTNDEIPELILLMYEALKGWQPNIKTPRDALRSLNLFTFSPANKIYIDPQRHLLVDSSVRPDRPVDPNGNNLIEKLLYLACGTPKSSNRHLYERISESFTRITNGIVFHVEPSGEMQLTLSFHSPSSDRFVPASESGFGLREALYFLYVAHSNTNSLICIDEIESHLHPELQRKLVCEINKINNGNYIIASTHSNVIVSTIDPCNVYQAKIHDNSLCIEQINSLATTLSSLGYSILDNLVSDMVIFVEGVTDIPFYKSLLSKYIDLGKYKISYITLGGNMMEYMDVEFFSQIKRAYAIIDRDDKSVRSRARFTSLCESSNVPCYKLERYAAENYIPIEIMRKHCPILVPPDINGVDNDKKLNDQGINIEKKKLGIMAAEINKDEIEKMDINNPLSEITAWLTFDRRPMRKPTVAQTQS